MTIRDSSPERAVRKNSGRRASRRENTALCIWVDARSMELVRIRDCSSRKSPATITADSSSAAAGTSKPWPEGIT